MSDRLHADPLVKSPHAAVEPAQVQAQAESRSQSVNLPPPPSSSAAAYLASPQFFHSRPRYPPEDDEGFIEYKWQLLSARVSPSRLDHLLTQMLFRLREGMGRCTYCIGVADDGVARGLDWETYCLTRETVFQLASAAGAIAMEVRRYQFHRVKENDDLERQQQQQQQHTGTDVVLPRYRSAQNDNNNDDTEDLQGPQYSGSSADTFLYSGEIDIRLSSTGERVAMKQNAVLQAASSSSQNLCERGEDRSRRNAPMPLSCGHPHALMMSEDATMHVHYNIAGEKVSHHPEPEPPSLPALPLHTQIALCGPLFSGKTTLLSVLLSCQQDDGTGRRDEPGKGVVVAPFRLLDDGDGKARQHLLSHRHEIETGRNGSRAIARTWTPPADWRCPSHRTRRSEMRMPTEGIEASMVASPLRSSTQPSLPPASSLSSSSSNSLTLLDCGDGITQSVLFTLLHRAPDLLCCCVSAEDVLCFDPSSIRHSSHGSEEVVKHHPDGCLGQPPLPPPSAPSAAASSCSSAISLLGRSPSISAFIGIAGHLGLPLVLLLTKKDLIVEDELEWESKLMEFTMYIESIACPSHSRANSRVNAFKQETEGKCTTVVEDNDSLDEKHKWWACVEHWEEEEEEEEDPNPAKTGQTHDDDGSAVTAKKRLRIETRVARIRQREVLPVLTVSSVTGEGLSACGRLFAAMTAASASAGGGGDGEGGPSVASPVFASGHDGIVTNNTIPTSPFVPSAQPIHGNNHHSDTATALCGGQTSGRVEPQPSPNALLSSSLAQGSSGATNTNSHSSPLFPPHPLFLAVAGSDAGGMLRSSSVTTPVWPSAPLSSSLSPPLLSMTTTNTNANANAAVREYFEFLLDDLQFPPALLSDMLGGSPPASTITIGHCTSSSSLPSSPSPRPNEELEMELRGRLSRGSVRVGQSCMLGPLAPQGRFVSVGHITALQVDGLHVFALQASRLGAADTVWMTVRVKPRQRPSSAATDPGTETTATTTTVTTTTSTRRVKAMAVPIAHEQRRSFPCSPSADVEADGDEEEEHRFGRVTQEDDRLLAQFLTRFQRNKRHPKGRVLIHTPPLVPQLPPQKSPPQLAFVHSQPAGSPLVSCAGAPADGPLPPSDCQASGRPGGKEEEANGVRRKPRGPSPSPASAAAASVAPPLLAPVAAVSMAASSPHYAAVSWGCVLQVRFIPGSLPLLPTCQPLLLARHTIQAVGSYPFLFSSPSSTDSSSSCSCSCTGSGSPIVSPIVDRATDTHSATTETSARDDPQTTEEEVHLANDGHAEGAPRGHDSGEGKRKQTVKHPWPAGYRYVEFLFSPEMLWVNELVVLLWPPNGLAVCRVVTLVSERRCAVEA